jgi:hypothetical protein
MASSKAIYGHAGFEEILVFDTAKSRMFVEDLFVWCHPKNLEHLSAHLSEIHAKAPQTPFLGLIQSMILLPSSFEDGIKPDGDYPFKTELEYQSLATLLELERAKVKRLKSKNSKLKAEIAELKARLEFT